MLYLGGNVARNSSHCLKGIRPRKPQRNSVSETQLWNRATGVNIRGHSPCQMITKSAALLSLALILSICSATLARSSSLVSAQPAQSDSLDARVKAEVAQFKGKVNLFAKKLDTGETYAVRADERVRTASTIKDCGDGGSFRTSR